MIDLFVVIYLNLTVLLINVKNIVTLSLLAKYFEKATWLSKEKSSPV